MANPLEDEFNSYLLEEILITHFQDKVKFINDKGEQIDLSIIFSPYGILPVILYLVDKYAVPYFNSPIIYTNKLDEKTQQAMPELPKPIFNQISRIISRLSGFQLFLIIFFAEIVLQIEDNYNEYSQIKILNIDDYIRFFQGKESNVNFKNIFNLFDIEI